MVVKSKGISPKSPKHSGLGIIVICPEIWIAILHSVEWNVARVFFLICSVKSIAGFFETNHWAPIIDWVKIDGFSNPKRFYNSKNFLLEMKEFCAESCFFRLSCFPKQFKIFELGAEFIWKSYMRSYFFTRWWCQIYFGMFTPFKLVTDKCMALRPL